VTASAAGRSVSSAGVGFWLVGFSCVFSMSLKVVKDLKANGGGNA
jgi:hypothetical protein